MSSGRKQFGEVYSLSAIARGSFSEMEFMFGFFSNSPTARQRLNISGWMQGFFLFFNAEILNKSIEHQQK
jgi:hypothetical protein